MSINDGRLAYSKSEALEAWAVRKFEWSASWAEAMLYTAEKQPAVLRGLCAAITEHVSVRVEQSLPGNLSIEDGATLRQGLFDMPRTMSDLRSSE